MTVQPFSSCVVVTVRPLASVADDVARDLPPPLLRELEDTLTDELDELEDELDAELDDRAEPLPLALFAMLLVLRPSSPIRTTSQSSGMSTPPLGAVAPISRPAAPHRAYRALTSSSPAEGKGAAPIGTAPLL